MVIKKTKKEKRFFFCEKLKNMIVQIELKRKTPQHVKMSDEPKVVNKESTTLSAMQQKIIDIVKSQSRMYDKFESSVDLEHAQEYCTLLRSQCVGVATNANAGHQFYTKKSLPLVEKSGWKFYLKYDTEIPWPEMFNTLRESGLNYNRMQNDLKEKYKQKPETKSTSTQPPKSSQSPKPWKKRFVGYSMNVGRINNQLFSFEAMIQYCVYYNRTLVIPWPRHRNQVMGFESGMWDWEFLSRRVDVILEHELPSHLKDYRNMATNNPCRFHKLVGRDIPSHANDQCEMIYLFEGEFGIFKFEDGPHGVMQYVRPALYIREAVETWLRKMFQIAPNEPIRYRVGVHRRAMNEGGKETDTGNPYVCRWQSHGIKGDNRFHWLRQAIRHVSDEITIIGLNDQTNPYYAKLKSIWLQQRAEQEKNLSVYDLIVNTYAHSCAMDWYDLQNILIFHQQKLIQPGEKFFIAHDHQVLQYFCIGWICLNEKQDKKAIELMKLHGGIEQSSEYLQEWSQVDKQLEIHKSHCNDFAFCTDRHELMSKEETIFDMWALYYSEFLVGSWMSTLTRTVCHWKGFEESIYVGNQCWLKWKWDDTVAHKNNNWFTLEDLNWTALTDDHLF
ncbi:hypothetical protein RFI_35894 [Reticulomyxa filosa]|uniref:Uncharacterized protein n=1 Tax=Reticulomyxa filosa TaxID=46433 RepID=X6LLD9_RETFI|nr:hypothetical protein RFI_35894 [Reticulomyxa filosa]|eukprot:ETO01545.1 hypothetical protein RFI_35894 [Reticulomyxa filosa]